MASTASAPAKRTSSTGSRASATRCRIPALIFLGLCVLSAILAAFDVKVTYEVV